MGNRNLPFETMFSRNCHLINKQSSTFLSALHFSLLLQNPPGIQRQTELARTLETAILFHIAKVKHKQDVPPPSLTSF